MTNQCSYTTTLRSICNDKGVYHLHTILPTAIVTRQDKIRTNDAGRYTGISLCEKHFKMLLKAQNFKKYPTTETCTTCSQAQQHNRCIELASNAWFIRHRDRHNPVFTGIAHCEQHGITILNVLNNVKEETIYELPDIIHDDENGDYYMEGPDYQLPRDICFNSEQGRYFKYVNGRTTNIRWNPI